MKIIIFEPHPDDLLFGAGPFIFDLIKEKHDLHVVTVTDGRACYRGNQRIKMAEDDVASMRIGEAIKTIEFLGIPKENHHLLYFHDADGSKYMKEGIEKVKHLIRDADRIVLPSNNNKHVDHQATHDIAIGAAKELNLDIEYWVYFLPSYGRFNKDSEQLQQEIVITEELREKLLEWLNIYESQRKTTGSWKMYNRFLRRLRKVVIGKFRLGDKGKYHNF